MLLTIFYVIWFLFAMDNLEKVLKEKGVVKK